MYSSTAKERSYLCLFRHIKVFRSLWAGEVSIVTRKYHKLLSRDGRAVAYHVREMSITLVHCFQRCPRASWAVPLPIYAHNGGAEHRAAQGLPLHWPPTGSDGTGGRRLLCRGQGCSFYLNRVVWTISSTDPSPTLSDFPYLSDTPFSKPPSR